MWRGAGPTIVFGLGCQAGLHRISFDIADGIQEVIGVQWAGVKAALPEMAAGIAHAVDALGVLAVHGLEGAMNAVGIRWDDDEMHVIRHQAVREDGHLPDPRIGMQEAQVELRVAVLEKDLLAVITPLCDVVGDTWENDSVLSRHPQKLAGVLHWGVLATARKRAKMKGCVPSSACRTANGVTFGRRGIP